MCGRLVLPLAPAAAPIAGCAIQAQRLDGLQAPAVQTAERRVRVDRNCPVGDGGCFAAGPGGFVLA
jgi:hypothetical protein